MSSQLHSISVVECPLNDAELDFYAIKIGCRFLTSSNSRSVNLARAKRFYSHNDAKAEYLTLADEGHQNLEIVAGRLQA